MLEVAETLVAERPRFVDSPPRFRIGAITGSPFLTANTLSFGDLSVETGGEMKEERVEARMLTVEQLLEGVIQAEKRAVGRYPESPRVHTNLGLAYLSAGRFDEAMGALELAIQLDPGHIPALIDLGRLLIRKGM